MAKPKHEHISKSDPDWRTKRAERKARTLKREAANAKRRATAAAKRGAA